MKIAITGSSGFVGTALTLFLREKGFTVLPLKRPYNSLESSNILEGTNCIIHLAGESIVGRWTEPKKKKILESRVQNTKILVETISKLKTKPKSFLCASGIGYYGYNGGDKILTEDASPGDGFLASVCKGWEYEAQQVSSLGIRTINMRFGVVLSPHGGALKKMLPAFKLGVGGKLGTGDHWVSWIALEDLVSGIYHCMVTEGLSGPINFCTPNPVTNLEFTKTLGAALHRPTLFPVPKFILNLIFGEMAKEILLADQRGVPKKLLDSGFVFAKPLLNNCLKDF